MGELKVPVLRFESEADCRRAADVLRDQQFDLQQESNTEIGCMPGEDLDEAFLVLEAEGIACERAEKTVTRMGPRPLRPQV